MDGKFAIPPIQLIILPIKMYLLWNLEITWTCFEKNSSDIKNIPYIKNGRSKVNKKIVNSKLACGQNGKLPTWTTLSIYNVEKQNTA